MGVDCGLMLHVAEVWRWPPCVCMCLVQVCAANAGKQRIPDPCTRDCSKYVQCSGEQNPPHGSADGWLTDTQSAYRRMCVTAAGTSGTVVICKPGTLFRAAISDCAPASEVQCKAPTWASDLPTAPLGGECGHGLAICSARECCSEHGA